MCSECNLNDMKLLNYLNDSTRNDDKCHVLTDEEAKKLKRCLLSIYKDIVRVCEKYGLICMLGGGSALGAVRHKGSFIGMMIWIL